MLTSLVGVAGFSSEMDDASKEAARRCISAHLDETAGKHAPRPVWMVSGATTGGVPGLSYIVAGEKGIVRVGVTADEARQYSIAEQERILVIGHKFGDESHR